MRKSVPVRVFKWLDENFERYLAMFFAMIMFISMFAQVVMRYIFNSPLSWSEEVAIICFVMSVFLGGARAITKDQHVRIEIVTYKLSERNQHIARIIANMLYIVFCIVVSLGMVAVIQMLARTGVVTSITRIPKAYYYTLLPFCMWLSVLRLLQDSWERVKMIRSLHDKPDQEQEAVQ